jgi:arylformamidase
MRIHDITVPLSPELPVYPGDSPVTIVPWTNIADGDAANVTSITLCTHSGTHIDAPRHFNQNGLSVDNIPLEILIGKALVVEISGTNEIGRQDLERLPLRGAERLLLKTDNTALWRQAGFDENYVSLSVEAAQYLVESGVKLLGIDYVSVESVEGDGSVHRTLLDGGVLILEGVNLADVAPGEYELICLPLKVKDGDGAPVRALLRGGEESHRGHPDFDPHTTKWPLA